ncbi:hypothetical protein L2E82_21209 [Cichorium intybus]|uniref:Uncharacterized protein n=1 Tax=Cichorium intybus TaxID=13427 RepID=A0ACB9DW67_CICIN|nr:hypothetical protein L2E82_21209 [Cichorium intybus]
MSGTLVSLPDELIKTCITELNSLSMLTALEIELSIYDLLPHDFIFTRLKRFRICIGFSIESKMFQNTLKVRFPTEWGGIEVLFNRTEILHLHGWRLLTNSIDNRHARANFLILRNLKLERCDLCYLTEICQGQNRAVGEITIDEPDQLPLFENLHDLEIVRCVNLRRIFSLSAPTDFCKLESLKIIGCEMIEEIFLRKKRDLQDENSVVEIELLNLKCLILEDLPRLTGFCKDVSSIALPQLLELRLRNLPMLQSLNIVEENRSSAKRGFLNQKILSTTQLKVLSVSKMKINEIQNHLLPVSCFVNVSVMSFCYCDDLSSDILSGLLQKPKDLKVLHIERCDMVEVVFDIDRLLREGHAVLNNLCDLELEHLPTMKHIWKHGPETFVGFQNLTKLSISSCHQLTYVLSPSIAASLSHLQELSIIECRRLTVILNEETENEATQITSESALVFPRLKSLTLVDLPCLGCFCSGLHGLTWPLLESVWIDCCMEMMIFTTGTSNTPKLREISVNGKNHNMEADLNTDLRRWQQQVDDIAHISDDHQDDEDPSFYAIDLHAFNLHRQKFSRNMLR